MILTPAIIFLSAVVLTAGYLLWAVPKKITVFFFLPLMFLGYITSLDLLGWPVPYWAEWRIYEEGTYITHVFKEPDTIYVWANINGIPRAYSFPWSLELAKRLQRAGEIAENGTNTKMKFKLFKRSM